MKKILVISGSPRAKGNTHKTTRIFEEKLNKSGEYNFEYINLAKTDLQYCKGCLACMRKGESFCPCKDEALNLRDKLLAAEGVIFTSPVYVHTVNAIMKNFFDRFAYFCHQPHFIGKTAMLIVTTELSGIDETLEYMKFPVNAWGFKIADSFGIAFPSFKENKAYEEKCIKRIEEAAFNFHKDVTVGMVDQGFKKYIFFNLLKMKVTLHKNQLPSDYNFWQKKGWLNKPFYNEKNYSLLKSFLAKIMVGIRSKFILRKVGIVMPR